MRKIDSPYLRDLLLVGGGHAHVQVLKRFGMRPEPGIRLTLISRESESPYTGMLPGFIAGDYNYDDIVVDLLRLSRFANCRFIEGSVESVSFTNRCVSLAGSRPDVRFDTLSINTGGDNSLSIPGGEFVIPVKPIGRFVNQWTRILADLSRQKSPRIVIIGGGPGSVELAISLRQRIGLSASFVLVTRSNTLVPDHGDKVHEAVEFALHGNKIEVVHEFNVVAVRPRPRNDRYRYSLVSDADKICPADHIFSVTGVVAPAWLESSGFAVDASGCVKVNRFLQTESDPRVFAAGDIAALVDQERPKSGVYAVREGPILAENLRRQLTGKSLKKFRAQKNALALLRVSSSGAIASRGMIQNHGDWAWRYKDWIDRRFMRKFRDLPKMTPESIDYRGDLQEEALPAVMRCGGCGAKLGADLLQRVLHRLDIHHPESVEAGIGEDSAVINFGSSRIAMSCDGFRAMIDDPWLFGRIAAHHALSDLYAVFSQPTSALALITIPLMASPLMEEDLFQLMSGALGVFEECGVQLVGGHTTEGLELTIGFSVFGSTGFQLAEKRNLTANSALVLTKPIGTGVLLAGGMDGRCSASEVQQALDVMDRSNASAATIFEEFGAVACTDITGFGLAGHLAEMLRASGVGASIDLRLIPFLSGAVTAMGRGIQSSLQENNEQVLADCSYQCSSLDLRLRMLADPQTNGGLLASLTSGGDEFECIDELKRAGYTQATIIGRTYEVQKGENQLVIAS